MVLQYIDGQLGLRALFPVFELQQQTFLQILGRHSGGFEGLDLLQHLLHLGLIDIHRTLERQLVGDGSQTGPQIAVFFDAADDVFTDNGLPLVQIEVAQLLAQVFLQGGCLHTQEGLAAVGLGIGIVGLGLGVVGRSVVVIVVVVEQVVGILVALVFGRKIVFVVRCFLQAVIGLRLKILGFVGLFGVFPELQGRVAVDFPQDALFHLQGRDLQHLDLLDLGLGEALLLFEGLLLTDGHGGRVWRQCKDSSNGPQSQINS